MNDQEIKKKKQDLSKYLLKSEIINDKFTGRLTFFMSQGGIRNVERTENI